MNQNPEDSNSGIYLFIYITLPMNKQHITFTNIDNWQGTR